MASEAPRNGDRLYGARRDRPDERDFAADFAEVPADDDAVDLRRYVSEVYHQRDIQSCTANAACSGYSIDLQRQGLYAFKPSRLFAYYNARARDDQEKEDAGSSVRDILKAMNKRGVCPEVPTEACSEEGGGGAHEVLAYWPYETTNFATKPPKQCYEAAEGNTICKYERLRHELHQFRACLKAGFPFMFGFAVYPSFSGDDTLLLGTVPVPSEQERKKGPGELHCVLAVGYNDAKKTIIALNSWGTGWGDGGYFYMPYDYICDHHLCFDFWKIKFACENEKLRNMPHCTRQPAAAQGNNGCCKNCNVL